MSEDGEPLLALYAGEAKLGQLTEDQVRQLLNFVENDMVQREGVVDFARLLDAWLKGNDAIQSASLRSPDAQPGRAPHAGAHAHHAPPPTHAAPAAPPLGACSAREDGFSNL